MKSTTIEGGRPGGAAVRGGRWAQWSRRRGGGAGRWRVDPGHLLTAAASVTAGLSVLSLWWALPTAVAAFAAGRRPGRALPTVLVLVALLAAGLVAITVVPAWLDLSSVFVAVVVAAAMVPWFAGRFWRQYQDLVRAGWQRAGQLEREQRLVAEQARLRERARIAQDMHDVLGHDLSLIALSAGALQLSPDLAEPHRAAARDIRARAASAVERLGEVIGVLREEADGAPERAPDASLERLVAEASRAGLAVRLQITGDAAAAAPSPVAERAAYRVVQEALTNAAKHAPAAPVTVSVAYAATEAEVRVENGPPPPPGGAKGTAGSGPRPAVAPAPDGPATAGAVRAPAGAPGPRPGRATRATPTPAATPLPGDTPLPGAGPHRYAPGSGPHPYALNAGTNPYASSAGPIPHTSGSGPDPYASGAGPTPFPPGASPLPPAAGGRGLIGLDERVRLAGGSFACGPRAEGFAVVARIPHAGQARPERAAPAPADGPGWPSDGPGVSAPGGLPQEHRRARRRVRRTLLAALMFPLVTGAVLSAVLIVWDAVATSGAVLDPGDYARLRVGQDRAAVERVLPDRQTTHRPSGTGAPAAGTDCAYYAMTADPFDDRAGDAYRLCFRADTLVSLDVLMG